MKKYYCCYIERLPLCWLLNIKGGVFVTALILFLGIYSCNNNNHSNNNNDKGYSSFAKHIKDITFNNVGYSYYAEGVYRNKNTSKEFIWFADPTSDKCIKFFDLKGKLCDSVPLTQAARLLYHIGEIDIISEDTIILKRYEYGNIIFINRKGDIWKKLDIDSITGNIGPNKKDYSYVSNIPINQTHITNTLYYKFYPEYIPNVGLWANVKNNVDREYHSPYFLKIKNIYSKHPVYQFGFNNFKSNIAKKFYLTNWVPNYTLINHKLFVINPFSDCLFQVNASSLKLEKKIRIQSKYIVIGAKPLKITKENMEKLGGKSSEIVEKSSTIQSIHFYKNKYFVIIQDAQQKGPSDKDGVPNYTIILYDTLFHKLGEYQINPHKDQYLAPTLFTSKGFLAFKWKKDEEKQLHIPNKTTYGLFRFKN